MKTGIVFFILSAFVVLLVGPTGNSIAMDNAARVANWYGNTDGAVSLRFDDNRESHIDVVVPALDRYGFKATFLVNPGKESYIKNRGFWEGEVVRKGHRLGNHTMHHEGAKSLEEAEFEVGETTRILRAAHKGESDLMVFAAGGLTRWGGMQWEKSSEIYKNLVGKYSLIDLYDGFHEAKHVSSDDTPKDLCGLAQKTMATGTHQPFVFHDIGSPSIKDLAKQLYSGSHLTMSKDDFTDFLGCLNGMKEKVWIAPLIQIYKYEAERNSATLAVKEKGKKLDRLQLKVGTNPDLYDQKLTVILPDSGRKILRILQEGEPVQEYRSVRDMVLIQVKPRTSEISINYE